jgi:hypothetical protein
MSEAPRAMSEAPRAMSEAPRAMSAWAESLDALAALVDRQRRHLAGEASAPADVWIPPSTPLPAEMRARAMVLHHETEELTAQLRRRLTSASDARVSPYA